MNYFRAFLIILFLFVIQIVLEFGFLGIFDSSFREYINIEFLTIYYIFIGITSLLTTYLIGIKLFKIKLNLNNLKSKLTSLNLKIFLYLIIVIIGLKLVNRPFLDIKYFGMKLGYFAIEPYKFSELTLTTIITRMILYLIIAPIFEEIIFRKYILTKLLKRYSIFISIVISSIYFSLFHLPSYLSLMPTLIFGIIACIVYIKTRNIIYPIFLHFLYNLYELNLQLNGKHYYEWIHNLNFNLTYWILFAIGLVITSFGIKKIATGNN